MENGYTRTTTVNCNSKDRIFLVSRMGNTFNGIAMEHAIGLEILKVDLRMENGFITEKTTKLHRPVPTEWENSSR